MASTPQHLISSGDMIRNAQIAGLPEQVAFASSGDTPDVRRSLTSTLPARQHNPDHDRRIVGNRARQDVAVPDGAAEFAALQHEQHGAGGIDEAADGEQDQWNFRDRLSIACPQAAAWQRACPELVSANGQP